MQTGKLSSLPLLMKSFSIHNVPALYLQLMIGDSGVGKTCLLLRYANDSFSPTFITTIGIDFKIKNVEVDGKRIKLQIWDTAGQERFRTITTSYFRGAQGILLVYDVTDRRSFESIRNWISQIQQVCSLRILDSIFVEQFS